MDRATRTSFLLALTLIVVVAAAAVYVLRGVGGPPTGTSQASGVIVRVDSEGLDRVRGFELRTPDGSIVSFALGNLENPTAFPPGHLAEHQATAQPVRVSYRLEGGINVAVRLEDAP